MTINPTFEQLKEVFPDLHRKFTDLYNTVSQDALNEKTKQLVYLGILTASRYSPAIRVHIHRALVRRKSRKQFHLLFLQLACVIFLSFCLR